MAHMKVHSEQVYSPLMYGDLPLAVFWLAVLATVRL